MDAEPAPRADVRGAWRRRIATRLHPFRPRLLDALVGYDRQRFLADCGAGVTVGIVALPLAMAFAIASGVKPEQGLFTAIIAGFLVAALGGSNVQIGGPAGAFVVVVYSIVQQYGIANLLIATVLAGALLLALGALKLGALVHYIPVSIVVGFTNGIAVLIAVSQVKDLLGLRIDKVPADFFSQIRAIGTHLGSVNPHALGLGLACLAGLFLWARLARGVGPERTPRALSTLARLPGPIVALVSLSALAAWLQLPVETIGSRFGGIPQGLPSFAWPAFEWASVQRLVVPTLTIALLGAVESLLCARVADSMSSLRRHDPNQELMAQGVANIVAPFFGGIPATGNIARTVTNLRAGATTPVAGMVHAVTLLAVVLVAAPLAADVPLAVLAGVLLFVAWNMGEWRAFRRLSAFSLANRAKLLAAFVLTIVVDLTVAMEVGMAAACVVFVYRMGALFRVDRQATPPSLADDVVVYRLRGPLFFGAVAKVEGIAEALPAGARVLVVDAEGLLSIDASGLTALENVRLAAERSSVRFVVCGLAGETLAASRRWGLVDLIGADNLFDDRERAFAALAAGAMAK